MVILWQEVINLLNESETKLKVRNKESKTLGSNIRKLRLCKAMSQYELADFCRVTQAYISLLEEGKKNNPTSNVLNKIAEALGANIDDLFKAISSPNEN